MRSVLAMRLAPALAVVASCAASNLSRGDDFRILSRVYVGDNKEHASQTVTIFRAGLVYDCIDSPAEVIVFDPTGGRFVLLAVDKKLRAEIKLPQIEVLLPALQERLSKQGDDLSTFLAAPQFDEQSDPKTGEIELSSQWVNYHVQGVAARNDAVAAQYATFSWHYTRLNALKHPMLLARAVVNERLNRHRLIPEQVKLTTFKKGFFNKPTADGQFRSQHIVTWGLSSDDLRRVEETERYLVEFRPVRLTEYWAQKDPGESNTVGN